MKSPVQLNYCVIDNPFLKDGFLIFVSDKGTFKVNDSLGGEEYYDDVVQFFENIGFSHAEISMFETNPEFKDRIYDKNILHEKLRSCGLKFSQKLHNNTMKEMEMVHKSMNNLKKMLSDGGFSGNVQSIRNPETPGRIKLFENKFHQLISPTIPRKQYKVPEIGEKIKLSFYLFLDCAVKENNDIVIFLNGDVMSKKNRSFRNFLKITDSNFERIEGKGKSIILKSLKTHREMMAGLNILKEGFFEISTPMNHPNAGFIMKTIKYVYNLIQVNDKLALDHHIVMEVSKKDYDTLIYQSKLISKEKELEDRIQKTTNSRIKTRNIQGNIRELKKILKISMDKESSVENYEEAANWRDKIKFLTTKNRQLKEIGKEIEVKQFNKMFSI